MGRQIGGKNISHRKDEKFGLVKRNLAVENLMRLAQETAINNSQMHYPSKDYRTIADTLLNVYGWRVSDISVWKSIF